MATPAVNRTAPKIAQDSKVRTSVRAGPVVCGCQELRYKMKKVNKIGTSASSINPAHQIWSGATAYLAMQQLDTQAMKHATEDARMGE